MNFEKTIELQIMLKPDGIIESTTILFNQNETPKSSVNSMEIIALQDSVFL